MALSPRGLLNFLLLSPAIQIETTYITVISCQPTPSKIIISNLTSVLEPSKTFPTLFYDLTAVANYNTRKMSWLGRWANLMHETSASTSFNQQLTSFAKLPWVDQDYLGELHQPFVIIYVGSSHSMNLCAFTGCLMLVRCRSLPFFPVLSSVQVRQL
jgi:hypothetical protein